MFNLYIESAMLAEDNEDHVITERTLQKDIHLLVEEILLISILDVGNVIPLCIVAMLDTQPDFSSFKKKVSCVLQKYKEWLTQEKQEEESKHQYTFAYPPYLTAERQKTHGITLRSFTHYTIITKLQFLPMG
ncbi:MAG: hypothetical protein ACTJLM_04570 [Ehrlichia sp.]